MRRFRGSIRGGTLQRPYLDNNGRTFPMKNNSEVAKESSAPVEFSKMDERTFRNWINKRLRDFIESGEAELKLESLRNDQRRITHLAARCLDLRSVSYGKEPNRFMVIRRARACASLFFSTHMNDTQSVELLPEQDELIRNFITKFPVESYQVEEHLAIPDTRRTQKRNGYGNSAFSSQRIVPPDPDMSQSMENFRVSLPTYRFREQVKRSVRTNKVTLITGGTGCGKTTQVPQFLLEDACSSNTPIRIICTQPRRLPAIAVSKRVAQERGERLGSTVGYHIRLEQKTSSETALTYCTSGVLLRMLSLDELALDITHIILDEIHEREMNTDYLLIALKQALKKRNDLKVILMSATMEGNLATFMRYFDNVKVARIDIPSRLYHVEKFDLAEVLALTGYMPRSIYGGLFTDCFTSHSNTWNKDDKQDNYDKFPPVGEFRSEEQIANVSSVDNFQHTQSNNHHHNHYHQNHHDLTTVKTAPDLVSFFESDNRNGSNHSTKNEFGPSVGFSNRSGRRSPSPDTFGESSFENVFGFDKRRENAINDAKKHLDKVLPTRPKIFQPNYANSLRQSRLKHDALIATYLNVGGQQWTETVDTDLALELIRYLMDSPVEGSILVFLPGYEDIATIRNQMNDYTANARTKPVVFTLHSQVNSHDQQKVFESIPRGSRKVILSTNIAEASLTIDDVVFVIDCGKVKEKTYDHTTGISQLKICWIAKSNAEQRSGRAGRCRNGFCFRLYSSQDYDRMLDTQVPEMRRNSIHEVCLHAKMFAPERMSVKAFLEMAPEPPPTEAVEHSLDFLQQLGALYKDQSVFLDPSNGRAADPENNIGREFGSQGFGNSGGFRSTKEEFKPTHNDEGELTELGRVVAQLPLEPQLARLLLFGLALRCLNPVVTLVAVLSHRDPFVLPMTEERTDALAARDEFGKRDFSDHLMLLRAFNAYAKLQQNQQHDFCRAKFLSQAAMKMIYGIRRQLMLELKRLRLIPAHMQHHDEPEFNLYSDCWPMVQGAIVAGCFPGIGFVKAGSKLRKIRTNTDVNASLHPGSVIKRQIQPNAPKRADIPYRFSNEFAIGNEPVIEYLAYQELAKIDEGLTLRTVTVVPPLTVLLFAGPIRVTKEIVENFELGEEDVSNDEVARLKLMAQLGIEPPDNTNGSQSFLGSSALSPKNQTSQDNDFEGWRTEEDDRSKTGIQGTPLVQTEYDDRPQYTMELASWLAFKGTFDVMQCLARLRFKLMSYFLKVLKTPHREDYSINAEDQNLLDCLSKILSMDHEKNNFVACRDLPLPNQKAGQNRQAQQSGNGIYNSPYRHSDYRKPASPNFNEPNNFRPTFQNRRFQWPDRFSQQPQSGWHNGQNTQNGANGQFRRPFRRNEYYNSQHNFGREN
ncbi:helicase associated domain (HA2) domain-containing protein [Ditylenchus destructor]|uniref:Helicase associated domain (HA2) domain-containing protein n=1 Tax=Ditylenchus destructor TaxID=166010 RepID=A0AAD4RDH9_9BILA|nr:helicase associated domain (HA2) domain-containing protein [Ditylenchus destructor]